MSWGSLAALMAIVTPLAGGVGWLIAQARTWGRLEGKLQSISDGIVRLEHGIEELERSREDQGRRIGAVEAQLTAFRAVDEDRSRPHRVGG